MLSMVCVREGASWKIKALAMRDSRQYASHFMT
jgi:hypothetical protein